MNIRWLLTIGLIVGLLGGLWWWSGGQTPTIAQAGADDPFDIRQVYPGLLESYEDAAARWNRMVPDRPMQLIRVLTPGRNDAEIRYANLWLMSRMLSMAGTAEDTFPPGTFSDITAKPVAGQAYVLVEMGGRESMIVFSPMPMARDRWQRGLLAPYRTVRRLGALLALTQDFLSAAKDGEILNRFADGIRGRWIEDPPQIWTLIGQQDQMEQGVSLFEFEQQLPSARCVGMGFRITTRGGRNQGCRLRLAWQPGRQGWDGWRVTAVSRTDHPRGPEILEP
jgi:hypothetical protein